MSIEKTKIIECLLYENVHKIQLNKYIEYYEVCKNLHAIDISVIDMVNIKNTNKTEKSMVYNLCIENGHQPS